MARYSQTAESLAALTFGAPATTTFNGYFAAIQAGSAAGFKLRRVLIGVRATAAPPTSQQQTIALYRQTVAPVGTGFTTTAGNNLDPNAPASAIGGLLVTTAATAGTTGPTIGSTALHKFTFNTQSTLDIPAELLEEWICSSGTANGLAFVNWGVALPSSHLYVVSVEWEE